MNSKTIEAGSLIDSRCTKCKILTIHTTVALVAGKVARVKCNSCGSEHNYHPPKPDKVPLTRRPATAKAGKSSAAGLTKKVAPSPSYEEQWNAALAKLGATTEAAYEMGGKYNKNTLIKHPIFGVGLVVSVGDDKMSVLFKDGPKWLGCRR